MLCVIAKLNEEATEKLMSIRTAALSDAALKPLHGHITIAAYTGDRQAQFVRFCKSLLEGTSAFAVWYEKIEVLDASSILVASPENSGAIGSPAPAHCRSIQRFSQPMDTGRPMVSAYHIVI